MSTKESEIWADLVLGECVLHEEKRLFSSSTLAQHATCMKVTSESGFSTSVLHQYSTKENKRLF